MASVITFLGEEWVVDRLLQSDGGTGSSDAGKYVGWGTGSSAGGVVKSSTTLFTESNDPVSSARTLGTASKTGTGTTAKWQLVGIVPSATSQTIQCAGTFKGGGASTLYVAGDFSGIALVNGDSIQFTFTLDPA